MLTFSTKPSPKSHDLQKLPNPTQLPQQKIQQQQLEHLLLHPQFQFHPPILPQLPPKKPPHPQIQPHPNLFLFPTLQPPNIPYKIPQPLPAYDPIPPVLQELDSPVDDLSHGCATEDGCNLSNST
ncbi:phosphate acyltransferase, partial [Staphylococcus auricularis]|uniref:phosphate acyltransferase n=1 Tax=Staphylococcus auricularis TaxID=29379 RepID=UPI00384ECD0D